VHPSGRPPFKRSPDRAERGLRLEGGTDISPCEAPVPLAAAIAVEIEQPREVNPARSVLCRQLRLGGGLRENSARLWRANGRSAPPGACARSRVQRGPRLPQWRHWQDMLATPTRAPPTNETGQESPRTNAASSAKQRLVSGKTVRAYAVALMVNGLGLRCHGACADPLPVSRWRIISLPALLITLHPQQS